MLCERTPSRMHAHCARHPSKTHDKTDNYMETVHGGLELELNPPYLMYTHGDDEVRPFPPIAAFAANRARPGSRSLRPLRRSLL